jgi:hypothetical protein
MDDNARKAVDAALAAIEEAEELRTPLRPLVRRWWEEVRAVADVPAAAVGGAADAIEPYLLDDVSRAAIIALAVDEADTAEERGWVGTWFLEDIGVTFGHEAAMAALDGAGLDHDHRREVIAGYVPR